MNYLNSLGYGQQEKDHGCKVSVGGWRYDSHQSRGTGIPEPPLQRLADNATAYRRDRTLSPIPVLGTSQGAAPIELAIRVRQLQEREGARPLGQREPDAKPTEP